MTESSRLGVRARAMLDELAGCTEEPGAITRPFLTGAHRRAVDLVQGWMRSAGLTAHVDAVGTVVGSTGAGAGRPRLLIGSHIDTVPQGGRFDGMLGVVVGILVAERLRAEGRELPFELVVLAFGDEEGLRFPSAPLGSASLVAPLPARVLDAVDSDGIGVRDALEAFGLARDPALEDQVLEARSLRGYLEVHIEQGPVLQHLGAPLAVVSSIAAAWRAHVRIGGDGGHAGTVPMALRTDALAAAAEMIGAVERVAGRGDEVRGTVGELTVAHAAANAIPSEVEFTIDLRAPLDDALGVARGEVVSELERIAVRRSVSVRVETDYEGSAAVCDPGLSAVLRDAVAALGLPTPTMTSGAGHDAQTLAAITPIAMLFVRCRDGVSHSPAEDATAEDVGLSVLALHSAVVSLAQQPVPEETAR